MSDETNDQHASGLQAEITRVREAKRVAEAALAAEKAAHAETRTALQTKGAEYTALEQKAGAFQAEATAAADAMKRATAAESQAATLEKHMQILALPGMRVDDPDVRDLVLLKYEKAVAEAGDAAPAFADYLTGMADAPLFSTFKTAAQSAAPPAKADTPPAVVPPVETAPPVTPPPITRDTTVVDVPPNGGGQSIWKRLADNPDGVRTEFGIPKPAVG